MSPSRRRAAAQVLASAVLLTAAACVDDPEPRPPADRDTIGVDREPIEVVRDTIEVVRDTIGVERDTLSLEESARGAWTAGVVDIPSDDARVSLLVSVRAARHEGFDRIVWELEGDMPGVHVEYVDEPVRACGSGEPVPLPGDAWLEVRMSPANAHTDAGRATIAERRRATGLPVVLEIVQTCDFEAVVSWVLAVRSPEPFRLTRLDDPSRLAVDVRHRR